MPAGTRTHLAWPELCHQDVIMHRPGLLALGKHVCLALSKAARRLLGDLTALGQPLELARHDCRADKGAGGQGRGSRQSRHAVSTEVHRQTQLHWRLDALASMITCLGCQIYGSTVLQPLTTLCNTSYNVLAYVCVPKVRPQDCGWMHRVQLPYMRLHASD